MSLCVPWSVGDVVQHVACVVWIVIDSGRGVFLFISRRDSVVDPIGVGEGRLYGTTVVCFEYQLEQSRPRTCKAVSAFISLIL